MKSEEYKDGMLHGYLKTYYEDGGIFEKAKFEFGSPKYLIIYNEDGSVADKKGFMDNKLIERIVG
jgi:antitoxin component YwqK of YwqJK toxin-antitoxin module